MSGKSIYAEYLTEKGRFETLLFLTPSLCKTSFLWSETKAIHSFIAPIIIEYKIELELMKSIKVIFMDVYQYNPLNIRQACEVVFKKSCNRIPNNLLSKLVVLWVLIEGPDDYRIKEESIEKLGILSYDWNPENDKMIDIYQAMVGKWISKECTFDQFSAIFSKTPLNEITPIKWNSNYVSEVISFIKNLHRFNLSGTLDDILRLNYVRMEACFIKKNGQPFRNFKQVKYNLDQTMSRNKDTEIARAIYNNCGWYKDKYGD